jgi:hypothetical protein
MIYTKNNTTGPFCHTIAMARGKLDENKPSNSGNHDFDIGQHSLAKNKTTNKTINQLLIVVLAKSDIAISKSLEKHLKEYRTDLLNVKIAEAENVAEISYKNWDTIINFIKP